MTLSSVPRVCILGRGRVGLSLDAAFRAAGLISTLVPGRSGSDLSDVSGQIFLLAVPDGEIETVAQRLAAEAPPGLSSVVHLSGALSTDGLRDKLGEAVGVGSFHPFLPFSRSVEPAAFHGVTIGIEASTPALQEVLEHLARRLRAVPRVVPKEVRALYHSAAVSASSHLVALTAHAATMLLQLGWSKNDALATLLPLISGTVENLRVSGLPEALSGPLRRGDASTVLANLRAIHALELPTIEQTYRLLSLTGIDLAEAVGLGPDDVARLRTAVMAPIIE